MPMNHPLLTVSELNRSADELLREGLGLVGVEGEVSNLRPYASGHQYFSLKDSAASISCTLFRSAARFAAPFKDGDHVQAYGRVGVYAARGQYQLIVERLEAAGEGRLLLAFQALKAQLLAEGLFAPERKRPLPAWVHRLGVITSAQGDVRHDIERTLARRFPLLLPFKLYPVLVQGPGAAAQIVAALEQAGQEAAVDVLILARGGGSLEDLWPFNEEAVARAIVACPVPVVTGIGHETDTTIADFAADLRASTPTAAAEAVSPDASHLRQLLNRYGERLRHQMHQRLHRERQSLLHFRHRLERQSPERRLEQHAQRLDELRLRLDRSAQRVWRERNNRFTVLQQRWQRANPQPLLTRLGQRTQDWQQRLLRVVGAQWSQRQQRLLQQQRLLTAQLPGQRLLHLRAHLQQLEARLLALSPDAVLARGYAILQQPDGRMLRVADPALTGTRLHARLAQGELEVEVVQAFPAAKPTRRKRSR